MVFAVLFFASLSGLFAGFAMCVYDARIQSHWPWTIGAAVLWLIAASFTIASTP